MPDWLLRASPVTSARMWFSVPWTAWRRLTTHSTNTSAKWDSTESSGISEWATGTKRGKVSKKIYLTSPSFHIVKLTPVRYSRIRLCRKKKLFVASKGHSIRSDHWPNTCSYLRIKRPRAHVARKFSVAAYNCADAIGCYSRFYYPESTVERHERAKKYFYAKLEVFFISCLMV